MLMENQPLKESPLRSSQIQPKLPFCMCCLRHFIPKKHLLYLPIAASWEECQHGDIYLGVKEISEPKHVKKQAIHPHLENPKYHGGTLISKISRKSVIFIITRKREGEL